MGGKRPIEQGWTKDANYSHDSSTLQAHIASGGNYGVLGGYGNLCIIDFDSFDAYDKIGMKLPPTFTVKSGGKGMPHLYYLVDKTFPKIPIHGKKGETLLDIQCEGSQVVGPGSKLIENGAVKGIYHVSNDRDIASISSIQLLSLIHETFGTEIPVQWDDVKSQKQSSKLAEDIKSQLSWSRLLSYYGIDTRKNPTMCPLKHDSVRGSCFSFDDQKGLAYCHHCKFGGDVITLVMKSDSSDFLKACQWLKETFDLKLTEEIKQPEQQNTANGETGKKIVLIDEEDINKLAQDIIICYDTASSWKMYYRPKIKDIVEIVEYTDKKSGKKAQVIQSVQIARFINILQERIEFRRLRKSNDDYEEYTVNLSDRNAKLLMTNTSFLNSIPKIDEIVNYTACYVVQGQLKMTHIGYNEDLEIYVTEGSPTLEYMPAEKALKTLKPLLQDFCFEKKLDKVMAYAYVLTPFARGFYARKTCRTPLFMIKANRERAGKDYLAGCVGLIYENTDAEEPPISTDDKSNNSEELRKRITSHIILGRRRYHSSNNKGKIDCAFFEQVLTSEVYNDRMLAKNEMVTLEHELEYSLSANIGMGYSSDLKNRMRSINLFYVEEDANSRVFSIPDLKGYVREHRGEMLSAIYSLFKDWYDAGSKSGSVPFTSFPEWARVVGGVMDHHGMGNPCEKQEDDAVGGDYETTEMKKLFEYFYTLKGQSFKTSDMYQLISANGDLDIFSAWDFNQKRDVTKFGMLIKRYTNRILSDIQMSVAPGTITTRASRIYYVFNKYTGNVGNLDKYRSPSSSPTINGNVGNLYNLIIKNENNNNNNNIKSYRNAKTHPELHRMPLTGSELAGLATKFGFDPIPAYKLLAEVSIHQIEAWQKDGLVCEPVVGHYAFVRSGV